MTVHTEEKKIENDVVQMPNQPYHKRNAERNLAHLFEHTSIDVCKKMIQCVCVY